MAYNLQKWIDRSASLSEAEQQGLPTALVDRILSLRGISREEQLDMLATSIPDLSDPFDIRDMRVAVDTIIDLIAIQGHIVIHGDYDTDGVTSTAILIRSFRALGLQVDSYIPNRLTDGYGLAEAGVDFAIEKEADLVVTCDCGVQSFDEVAQLKRAGIPVIITDHHQCADTLPDALAVVNPNRLDDNSSVKGLAGAGVALKLVQALARTLDHPSLWQSVVDLAAVGTVGDAMVLTAENRSIVRLGLEKLNKDPNPGLAALMKAVRVDDKRCTAIDIGFKISPKINAAGRLGDSAMALNLLLSDQAGDVQRLAASLLEQNDLRKNIEGQAIAAALNQIAENPTWLKHQAVVVSLENAHAGVMGILAGRLSEMFACPVIVFMLDRESEAGEAFWRGSARSYGSCNILDLIADAGVHTRSYGGHPAAAGVEIDVDKIDAFRAAIQEAADDVPASYFSMGDRFFDCELRAADVSLEQARDLERLEPYGEGNPVPLFRLSKVHVAERRLVGANRQHLRLSLALDGLDHYVPAIFFGGAAHLGEEVKTVDLIVSVHVNRFRGAETLQLLVEDFAQSNDSDRMGEAEYEVEQLYLNFHQWGGAELAAILGKDQTQLAPDKELLAGLYRLLASLLAGSPRRVNVTELTDMLESVYNINSNDFHVRRVIDIYSEAGLIVVRKITEHELLLGLVKANGKTDLYETATWKRLTVSS